MLRSRSAKSSASSCTSSSSKAGPSSRKGRETGFSSTTPGRVSKDHRPESSEKLPGLTISHGLSKEEWTLIAKKHDLPSIPAFTPFFTTPDVNPFGQLVRLRLDRCGLTRVPSLTLFPVLTHLYLQHNAIAVWPRATPARKSLEFLILAHNQLTSAEAFHELEACLVLDISCNAIQDRLDEKCIPPNVQILHAHGNPCAQHIDYRLALIQELPELEDLDGKELTLSEKRIQVLCQRPVDGACSMTDNGSANITIPPPKQLDENLGNSDEIYIRGDEYTSKWDQIQTRSKERARHDPTAETYHNKVEELKRLLHQEGDWIQASIYGITKTVGRK